MLASQTWLMLIHLAGKCPTPTTANISSAVQLNITINQTSKTLAPRKNECNPHLGPLVFYSYCCLCLFPIGHHSRTGTMFSFNVIPFSPQPWSLSNIWCIVNTKWMNKRNIWFHQRAIFFIHLKGLSLSLLTFWAWTVLTRRKMIAEETRSSPSTEAMATPITKGSDTSSSQCSPRYHQFSPTRHLEGEVTKFENEIALLRITINSRIFGETRERETKQSINADHMKLK